MFDALILGQMIDFTTDTISTDYYESINGNKNMPSNRMSTEATTMLPSKSASNKMQIGMIAMKILVVTVFILLLSFLLLLIVRRYFNARKLNSNNSSTFNTHSIKYISNKQLNKIHIDMNAENANSCEKADSEICQRPGSECESQIDANVNENEQNKNKANILNRVKRQLFRPTLLAAAGRYCKLKETM